MSRLHWYGPPYGKSRGHRRLGDPYSRWARYHLYVPEEQWNPNYSNMGRDKYGPWVWMGTDCGWEWLATRSGIYGTPLAAPFWKLHEHVHTPGSW